MAENIDPTWIAYALAEPVRAEALDAGLRRVENHYGALVDYPLRRRAALGARRGVAVIGDADSRCGWSHFASDRELTCATAYVPTGWTRLVGSVPAAAAPLPLARAVADDPDAAIATLNAPFALGVVAADERLVIVNDALGAARLYELALDGGTIWSNRVGALPLFAGIAPRPDREGWLVLAAAAWFLAGTTSMADVTQVGPGTVIEADDAGTRARRSDVLARLVGSGAGGEALADRAAEQAVEQASLAGELWSRPARVDLSGGRDSRVVAAAVVKAGTRARFLTSDATPGEADVARRLIAAAPGELEHQIRRVGDDSATPQAPLGERARNLHLVHDGMRHPQKLRGKNTLPRSRPSGAVFSGHGGEIAHGFFYGTNRELLRLRVGGERAIRERLMRFFAKDHEAARPEAYATATDTIAAILARGRELGVSGPALLDWFYLVDRFPHRSGLASDAERISIFSTPGFIEAAFAMAPRHRLSERLHRELIARLVPDWSDIPHFAAERSRMPRIRRRRLWEVEADAEAVEWILADAGSWTEIYDPDRVRSAWSELRAGGGSAKWEAVIEGVVYRHAFDEHIAGLAAEAASGPPLIGAPAARR